MKYVIVSVIGASAAIAAGIYFSADKTPTSADIVALVRNGFSPIEDADISLEKCQLTVKYDKSSNNFLARENTTRVYYSTNLGLYDFRTVRIGKAGNDRAVVTAQHKKNNDLLIQQAKKLNALTRPFAKKFTGGQLLLKQANGPIITENRFSQHEAENLDPKTLRKIFDNPNGTITYRLTSAVASAANGKIQEPQPHEDGPEFHTFAEAAIASDAPKTLAVTLVYIGNSARADKLLSGMVTIPTQFRLTASSQDNAKRLTEDFFYYTQKNCP